MYILCCFILEPKDSYSQGILYCVFLISSNKCLSRSFITRLRILGLLEVLLLEEIMTHFKPKHCSVSMYPGTMANIGSPLSIYVFGRLFLIQERLGYCHRYTQHDMI